jgi:ATP-dependent DNA ligase
MTRDTAGVSLYSRNGLDLSKRFPLIVAAIAGLPADPFANSARGLSCG